MLWSCVLLVPYLVTVLLVKMSLKLATATATVLVCVHLSMPDAALLPMASVTVVVLSPVSTLPLASSTATNTDGEIVLPATVVVGCCVYTNCVAVPTAMLKVLLAVVPCAGLLVAFRVYPVPVLLI